MASLVVLSRSKNFIVDWTGTDYTIPDNYTHNGSYLAIDHEGQMCVFSDEPWYDNDLCWVTESATDRWETIVYTINELPDHENYETNDACWKIPQGATGFKLTYVENEEPTESLPTYESYQHISLEEAFSLFAKDIEVQYQHNNGSWLTLDLKTPFSKIYNTTFRVGKLKEYVTINGIEVPKPVKNPKLKSFYWFIESHEIKGVKGKYLLADHELESLCWETKEDAMIAFEAFNSFFK